MSITEFFGRFHPLLVHLPIGIIILAFLLEVLSFFPRYRRMRSAVEPSLLIGAFFATVSSFTGFMLKQEGGYDDALIDKHQYFGIATTVLTILLFIARIKTKSFYSDLRKRKIIRIVMFMPLLVLLSATGHYGGSLTHGEDYLTFTIEEPSASALNSTERIRQISNVDQAVLYKDVIAPVLEAKCYSCHSSKKQKGDLRLDGEEFILRGGKHGSIVENGNPDSSALYARLLLPMEDEKHMPPSEKPQLTSAEINLINLWIKEGAAYNKPVAAHQQAEKLKQLIASIQYAPVSWVPEESVDAGSTSAIDRLTDAGVLVMPVNTGSNYLMINFLNTPAIAKQHLDALKELSDQLVWLNLGSSNITDDQLKMISELVNIRILYLNNTSISDNGVSYLKNLNSLVLLNLVNTKLTDAGLAHLGGLKNLTNLFLFQTAVTKAGVEPLTKANKTLKIDTGSMMLPKLATDTIVYKRKV